MPELIQSEVFTVWNARPVQRSAKVGAPGLVNFIPAVAYSLLPQFACGIRTTGASTLADLCRFQEFISSIV